MPTSTRCSVDKVMVEMPAPGAPIVLGLKVTTTPGGAPDAESAMLLLKPPLTVVVTVAVSCCPCGMERDDGVTDTVKVPEADTGRVKHKQMRTQTQKITALTTKLRMLCPLSPRPSLQLAKCRSAVKAILVVKTIDGGYHFGRDFR